MVLERPDVLDDLGIDVVRGSLCALFTVRVCKQQGWLLVLSKWPNIRAIYKIVHLFWLLYQRGCLEVLFGRGE